MSLSALPAAVRERLWRGHELVAAGPTSQPSGFAALDRELPGGGWPTRCLTELLLPTPGIGELRLLAPCLSRLTQEKRQIIVLAPPEAATAAERGRGQRLYPDGWEQLGIDLTYVVVVYATRPSDRLWAIEQSLRSAAFGALLAWAPHVRPEAVRRFQLAAAAADGLSFLIRPAHCQIEATAAPLRLLLQRPPESLATRSLAVTLLKRRGPLLGRPLLLPLPDPRPLRSRPLRRGTAAAEGPSPVALSHAVGRPLLSNTGTRPHPAPAA